MAFDWKMPLRDGAMKDARLYPEAAAAMLGRLGCAPEIVPKAPEPKPASEAPKPAPEAPLPEPLPKKPEPQKLDVKPEPIKTAAPQYGPVETVARALKDAIFGKKRR